MGAPELIRSFYDRTWNAGEIDECVAEGDRAFARMRFSGRHTAPLRGFAPSGREVPWAGAALFRFAGGVIAEAWVLGDLAGLDAHLAEQREPGAVASTRPRIDGARTTRHHKRVHSAAHEGSP